MKSLIAKRSVVLAGHKTSVSLEEEFWATLKEIAGDRRVTLSALVTAPTRLVTVLGRYSDRLQNTY
jgi:predicted DNA-binding ribbon-helix-helix protein